MIDITTILQDSTAWFSEETAIYIGSFGGAGIGTFGGILGALGGVLAPRGQARGFVIGSFMTVGVLGLLCLLFAGVALVMGQPSFVWAPFGLLGVVASSVCLPLVPVMIKRYDEAEARQLEAHSLRQS
jgi:hypothetical protein